MTNFAELYADTLHFTSEHPAGGSHMLHCWFSADTAYLPIKCRTLAIMRDCVKAIQAAAVAAGNVKPIMRAGD